MSANQHKNFKFLLLVVVFVLGLCDQAHAYIGPGAGFAVVGSFLAVFTAMFLATLVLLTWPIRYIFRTIRYRQVLAKSKVKRFIILGLDGMDPKLTENMIVDGKLPNFAKLRDRGCFKPLATTIPSMSPVAWSSFQTGVNPGKHNIFGFLTRDKQSYQPKLSSVDIKGPRRRIRLGKYQLALGKPDIRLLRKGKPFWKTLGEYGIFSSVIRVPLTFPPERFHGVQLSAICVPDLRGTQGMFSYYTTQTPDNDQHIGGEVFYVTKNSDTIKAELLGSENPLRNDNSILRCPFVVTIKDDNSANVSINNKIYELKKNVSTEWIKVRFKAAPGIKVHGICKFLLLSTTPEFQLYVTPINIDPEKPVMPISHPKVYSTYFAKLFGSYATLGLAEDSWALNEKILNEDSFLQQIIQTDAEREKMFFDSLDKVKQGLCVCVFDGTDRVQHCFWRQIDEEHPANAGDQQQSQNKNNAIEHVYQKMDALVGKTLEKCRDKNSILMVISDHGFSSFRYGIDLNRWLEENGYLKVKDGQRGQKHLAGIDWSQTRAFAIGLTGIFLNLKGRESQGIVDPGEQAAQLREEIAEKLVKLIDPAKQTPAIKQVYNALKVFRGPYKDQAPDLIVGYNRGYRASWETAIGQVTDKTFHDNTKAWSGDHCIDSSLVPGVLFCDRAIETEQPRLMDIGPTVLDMFGVEIPENMDGKPLVVADAETKS